MASLVANGLEQPMELQWRCAPCNTHNNGFCAWNLQFQLWLAYTTDTAEPLAEQACVSTTCLRCIATSVQHQAGLYCCTIVGDRSCLLLQVKNPATGEVIATVPCMKANETSAAVAEATSAWPEWSKKVAKERSKIMRKCVALGLST